MSQKHIFTLGHHDGSKPPITEQMARAVLEVLNGLEVELEIAQINQNHFENTFLVQMALHSEVLKEEMQAKIIKHVAHVSLLCDGIPTLIGIWERVGDSKILKEM